MKYLKFESYIETVNKRANPWPVTRLANLDYGLSGAMLNKVLCKLGILSKTTNDNRQYILNDKTLGMQRAFSKLNQEYTGYKKQNEFGNRDTIYYNKRGMVEIYKALAKNGIFPINELLLTRQIPMSIKFKENDLILVRRPGLLKKPAKDQIYYISYYKHKNENDYFGLDYQYLNEQRLNELTPLMLESELAKAAKRGPRVDSRDEKTFKLVEESMNNYYKLYNDYSDVMYEKYVDVNKSKCKQLLEV